jgi:hypothetical protein
VNLFFLFFVLNVVALAAVRATLVYTLMTDDYDLYNQFGKPGFLTNSYGFIFPVWRRANDQPEAKNSSTYKRLIVALAALMATLPMILVVWLISMR